MVNVSDKKQENPLMEIDKIAEVNKTLEEEGPNSTHKLNDAWPDNTDTVSGASSQKNKAKDRQSFGNSKKK